jgi:long-subunit acyl-CoA synthetase (AMP-forming)
MVENSLLECLWEGDPFRAALYVGQRRISAAGLAGLAQGAMELFSAAPPVVGLLGANSPAWIAAMIGLEALGRTVVPLPPFFSPGQLAHIISDAGIGLVLADSFCAPLLSGSAVAIEPLREMLPSGQALPTASGEAQQVIYTSGSTGTPKGVVLTASQATQKARLLAQAIHATPNDIVLSILPFSLLLEQIAAIRAPIVMQASVTLAQKGLPALMQGNPLPLIDEAEAAAPTIGVVVPEVLKGWTLGLAQLGRRAPASLRYVAVGGATIAAEMVEQAWAVGLPAHEGYGLSEAGSVVSLARPGRRKPGTAGEPLPGVGLAIRDGEILLSGPQITRGYLNRGPMGAWLHTGDLGSVDDEGFLVVDGRKDSMLRLSTGRNVQPEWLESLLTADPRVLRAVILGDGLPRPVAVVELMPGADADAVLARLAAALPDYARPEGIVPLPPGTFAARGLLTGNGRVRRTEAKAALNALVEGFGYHEFLSAVAS